MTEILKRGRLHWPGPSAVAGFTGIPATPDMVYGTGNALVRSDIGRNEPCRCGSGKKYKHCHLEKDKQEQRAG